MARTRNRPLCEALEPRTLLTQVSDLAIPLLVQRTAAAVQSFYVYQNGDSALNHGFPSGFFGVTNNLVINTTALDSPNSPTGTTTDPTQLDKVHGTVLSLTFAPEAAGQFVGVNFEEPEHYGVTLAGQGYNLTGATAIHFDARSPTPGGISVQFGVGQHVSSYMHIPQSSTYIPMSIPLSSLGLTNLSNVHILFSVASNDVNCPQGGTLLLDNIQFNPVPTSQSSVLSFPLSTQVLGVSPLQTATSGPIPFPSDQVLQNLTTTYESATTMLALLQPGASVNDLAQARKIANTLVYALGHDNHGDPLPTAPDGSAGLHNGYEGGDVALYNTQTSPNLGQQGDVRLAGFSASTQITPSGFLLLLDGASGGNNAFAILALAAAFRQFQDPTYLSTAEEIGHWIVGNLMDMTGTSYGGYFTGYPDQGAAKVLETGKSTENNADIFAAFTALASAEKSLGNAALANSWTTSANVAGDFVLAMYDPVKGRFNAGTVPAGTLTWPGIDPTGPQKGADVINRFDFLDSNSFTTLAMAASPRYQNQVDWRLPLEYVINNFAQSVTAGGKTYQGFDIITAPTSGPNGIAWEFTGQAVELMRFVDSLYSSNQFEATADFYMGQIQQAQGSAPFGDGAGLVASTVQGGDALPPLQQALVSPFQNIPERVGLGATTWAIFADQGINVFAPAPQILVSSTASSSTYGESLSFSANVASNVAGSLTPTGRVQFQLDGIDFGSSVTLVNGSATSIHTSSLSAGVHTVTAFYMGDFNDSANYGTTVQIVDPAHLTVTSDAKSMLYGGMVPGLTATITGFVNGDTASVVSGAANLSTSATSKSTVGTYSIVTAAGTLSAANYDFPNLVNGTLTINKAHLTVTADAKGILYGGTVPGLTATITGFVNGDTVSVVGGSAGLSTTGTSTSPVGTYPITVTAGTLSATNYDFPTLANGTLIIGKAHLTATADDKSKTRGTANPPLTYTITGFVNSETETTANVTGTPNLSTTAGMSSPPGGYLITITAGTLAAPNYDFPNLANGTLTVLSAGATMVNVGSTLPNSTYGDTVSFTVNVAPPQNGATPTGTVQFEFDGVDFGSAVTLVNGAATSGTISTLTATTHVITAIYSGDGTYPTNSGTYNQVVNKAHLTVTADAKAMLYGGSVPALTATITGFVNGDTASVVSGSAGLSTTGTSTSLVGTYSIVTAAGTLSAANYDFPNLVNGTLTINKAHLTATADAKAMLYGGSVPALTATITGFVNGDKANVVSGSAGLSTTGTSTSSVGTYPISVSIGSLSAQNYAFSNFVPGVLTVSPATTVGNYLGTGKTIPAVFRRVNAGLLQWYVQGSSVLTARAFGAGSPDVPLAGDFDGDGKTDIALYRPSTAQWYVQSSGSNYTGALLTTFGWAGVDIPAPGNFNGTGKTVPAVFRPTTGQWFVQGLTTPATFPIGSVAAPGDYDRVGKDEIAVYNPKTSQWLVASPGATASHVFASFGGPSDIPVPGAYDALTTGKSNLEAAVWRPTTGQFFINSPTGLRTLTFAVGDIPSPGDFDGIGVTEAAVYRPKTGQWLVQGPNDKSPRVFATYGGPSDVPTFAPYPYRALKSGGGLISAFTVSNAVSVNLGATAQTFASGSSTPPSFTASLTSPKAAVSSVKSTGASATRHRPTQVKVHTSMLETHPLTHRNLGHGRTY